VLQAGPATALTACLTARDQEVTLEKALMHGHGTAAQAAAAARQAAVTCAALGSGLAHALASGHDLSAAQIGAMRTQLGVAMALAAWSRARAAYLAAIDSLQNALQDTLAPCLTAAGRLEAMNRQLAAGHSTIQLGQQAAHAATEVCAPALDGVRRIAVPSALAHSAAVYSTLQSAMQNTRNLLGWTQSVQVQLDSMVRVQHSVAAAMQPCLAARDTLIAEQANQIPSAGTVAEYRATSQQVAGACGNALAGLSHLPALPKEATLAAHWLGEALQQADGLTTWGSKASAHYQELNLVMTAAGPCWTAQSALVLATQGVNSPQTDAVALQDSQSVRDACSQALAAINQILSQPAAQADLTDIQAIHDKLAQDQPTWQPAVDALSRQLAADQTMQGCVTDRDQFDQKYAGSAPGTISVPAASLATALLDLQALQAVCLQAQQQYAGVSGQPSGDYSGANAQALVTWATQLTTNMTTLQSLNTAVAQCSVAVQQWNASDAGVTITPDNVQSQLGDAQAEGTACGAAGQAFQQVGGANAFPFESADNAQWIQSWISNAAADVAFAAYQELKLQASQAQYRCSASVQRWNSNDAGVTITVQNAPQLDSDLEAERADCAAAGQAFQQVSESSSFASETAGNVQWVQSWIAATAADLAFVGSAEQQIQAATDLTVATPVPGASGAPASSNNDSTPMPTATPIPPSLDPGSTAGSGQQGNDVGGGSGQDPATGVTPSLSAAQKILLAAILLAYLHRPQLDSGQPHNYAVYTGAPPAGPSYGSGYGGIPMTDNGAAYMNNITTSISANLDNGDYIPTTGDANYEDPDY
jgi:hypothetical protein